MRKIAFLFPGQGSQYVGMGKRFLETYPRTRKIFQEAEKVLGFDLQELCLRGPEEELNRTVHTQPALLTINWIISQFLKEKKIEPTVVAGHSLGEYSALLAAEVLNYPTALRLVHRRAELMEEASKTIDGGMAAIIGLSREMVLSLCQKMEEVEAVNFNSPSQIVISGRKEKIERAIEEFRQKGARRVVPLSVSGAFHTSFMKDAARQFSQELDKIFFSEPSCPVITNAFAQYASSGEEVKKALKKQMDHPVLWEDAMRKLISDGVNLFIEVGPGKVLQGLLRRIDRNIGVIGAESPEELERII